MDSMRTFFTIREEVEEICFRRSGYPDAWPRHQSCPCCGSRDIRAFFSKFGISHWVCSSCSFVFVNPYPDASTLEELYNASYYPAVREYVEMPKARREALDISMSIPAEDYLKIISHVVEMKSGGAWLDVGGGIGNFLKFVSLKSRGFDLYLNEMNAESKAFAASHYGLTVLPEPPVELLRQGFGFDVITVLSVLEHTSHPLGFIKSYGALLKPGGIMVISIPRFSFLNRVFSRSASSNIAPPYHLSMFNDGNIRTLLEGTGMFAGITSWHSGPKAFSLIDLMRVAEYFDIEIPRHEMDAPKCIQLRPYTKLQNVAIDYLAVLDRKIGPLISRIDGRLLLTVAAQKKCTAP